MSGEGEAADWAPEKAAEVTPLKMPLFLDDGEPTRLTPRTARRRRRVSVISAPPDASDGSRLHSRRGSASAGASTSNMNYVESAIRARVRRNSVFNRMLRDIDESLAAKRASFDEKVSTQERRSGLQTVFTYDLQHERRSEKEEEDWLARNDIAEFRRQSRAKLNRRLREHEREFARVTAMDIFRVMPEEDVMALREQFLTWERHDGGSQLTLPRFVDLLMSCLQRLGYDGDATDEAKQRQTLADLFHAIDFDGSNTVEWDEFVAFMLHNLDDATTTKSDDRLVIHPTRTTHISRAAGKEGSVQYLPTKGYLQVVEHFGDQTRLTLLDHAMITRFDGKAAARADGGRGGGSSRSSGRSRGRMAVGAGRAGAGAGDPGDVAVGAVWEWEPDDKPLTDSGLSKNAVRLGAAADDERFAAKARNPVVSQLDLDHATTCVEFIDDLDEFVVMSQRWSARCYALQHHPTFGTKLLHQRTCTVLKPALCMKYSTPMESLFGGTQGGEVSVFPLSAIETTLEPAATIACHTEPVACVLPVPRMGRVISACVFGGVVLSDARRGVVLAELGRREERETGVHSMSYVTELNMLITSGHDPTLRLWMLVDKGRDPFIGTLVDSIDPHVHSVVGLWQDHHVAPNVVVSTDASGVVKLWDLRMMRCLHTARAFPGAKEQVFHAQSLAVIEPPRPSLLSGAVDSRAAAAATRANPQFLLFGTSVLTHSSSVVEMSMVAQHVLDRREEERSLAFFHQVACLYNPQTRTAISGLNNHVATYNISTGCLVEFHSKIAGEQTVISAMAIDQRGRRLFVGTDAGDIFICSASTGEITFRYAARASAITFLWSGMKKVLVACTGDGELLLFDADGDRKGPVHAQRLSVAVSCGAFHAHSGVLCLADLDGHCHQYLVHEQMLSLTAESGGGGDADSSGGNKPSSPEQWNGMRGAATGSVAHRPPLARRSAVDHQRGAEANSAAEVNFTTDRQIFSYLSTSAQQASACAALAPLPAFAIADTASMIKLWTSMPCETLKTFCEFEHYTPRNVASPVAKSVVTGMHFQPVSRTSGLRATSPSRSASGASRRQRRSTVTSGLAEERNLELFDVANDRMLLLCCDDTGCVVTWDITDALRASGLALDVGTVAPDVRIAASAVAMDVVAPVVLRCMVLSEGSPLVSIAPLVGERELFLVGCSDGPLVVMTLKGNVCGRLLPDQKYKTTPPPRYEVELGARLDARYRTRRGSATRARVLWDKVRCAMLGGTRDLGRVIASATQRVRDFQPRDAFALECAAESAADGDADALAGFLPPAADDDDDEGGEGGGSNDLGNGSCLSPPGGRARQRRKTRLGSTAASAAAVQRTLQTTMSVMMRTPPPTPNPHRAIRPNMRVLVQPTSSITTVNRKTVRRLGIEMGGSKSSSSSDGDGDGDGGGDVAEEGNFSANNKGSAGSSSVVLAPGQGASGLVARHSDRSDCGTVGGCKAKKTLRPRATRAVDLLLEEVADKLVALRQEELELLGDDALLPGRNFFAFVTPASSGIAPDGPFSASAAGAEGDYHVRGAEEEPIALRHLHFAPQLYEPSVVAALAAPVASMLDTAADIAVALRLSPATSPPSWIVDACRSPCDGVIFRGVAADDPGIAEGSAEQQSSSEAAAAAAAAAASVVSDVSSCDASVSEARMSGKATIADVSDVAPPLSPQPFEMVSSLRAAVDQREKDEEAMHERRWNAPKLANARTLPHSGRAADPSSHEEELAPLMFLHTSGAADDVLTTSSSQAPREEAPSSQRQRVVELSQLLTASAPLYPLQESPFLAPGRPPPALTPFHFISPQQRADDPATSIDDVQAVDVSAVSAASGSTGALSVAPSRHPTHPVQRTATAAQVFQAQMREAAAAGLSPLHPDFVARSMRATSATLLRKHLTRNTRVQCPLRSTRPATAPLPDDATAEAATSVASALGAGEPVVDTIVEDLQAGAEAAAHSSWCCEVGKAKGSIPHRRSAAAQQLARRFHGNALASRVSELRVPSRRPQTPAMWKPQPGSRGFVALTGEEDAEKRTAALAAAVLHSTSSHVAENHLTSKSTTSKSSTVDVFEGQQAPSLRSQETRQGQQTRRTLALSGPAGRSPPPQVTTTTAKSSSAPSQDARRDVWKQCQDPQRPISRAASAAARRAPSPTLTHANATRRRESISEMTLGSFVCASPENVSQEFRGGASAVFGGNSVTRVPKTASATLRTKVVEKGCAHRRFLELTSSAVNGGAASNILSPTTTTGEGGKKV